MRIRGTLAAALFVILAALAAVVSFAPRRVLAGGRARPIASLKPEERLRLPDNTMVSLPSGRTVSLGTLRAEHRARLQRFTDGAAQGQKVAAKLVASKPVSMTSTAKASAAALAAALAQRGPMVPFKVPLTPAPKDYVDFCKAANPTVCIYFPPNTAFTPYPNYPQWVEDLDPLIFDLNICQYDGGIQKSEGCSFAYPVKDTANFLPTGPITSAASCDPGTKHVVDPKGAAQVSYPSSTFTTGNTFIACVMQVWVAK